ncbi:MAG: NifB/NifX family molybdenum-iron cluster-binding protein [Limisphaerales bacterium]
MRVAIPNCQGRVSPVFDTAVRLLIFNRCRGRVADRQEIQLGVLPPGALAQSLAELRIDVLLCAAITQSLRRALEALGIRVVPHLCGEIEAIVDAFCHGHLSRSEFRMPGCWGRHEGEDCRPRRSRNTTPLS